MTQDSRESAHGSGVGELPGFDTSVANAARMWNYWIGGKDNFRADREAGDQVLAAMPALPLVARLLRRFLSTSVDELTAAGVRQFLDIGTGLPTADNTHDVAQRAAPESRIVYVDHDPVVMSHARALLTSSAQGTTDYIQADLRDWATISAGAQRTLDFSRPVAVLLIAVLHFIRDAEDPHRLIARDHGRPRAGQLPGHRACRQRHRSRYRRGDGPQLQRHLIAEDHASGPGSSGQVLRRHDNDRPGADAARPVAWTQPDNHHRHRPELLLRHRQKTAGSQGTRMTPSVPVGVGPFRV